MTTKEEPVEESIRDSQSDTGEVVFAPVNKKSSRASKSGATAIPEDEATPVEDESEAPHSAKQRTRGGSSARVLRSRQRGKPGPKAKSQPKRIKLEDSTEPGVADSQEAGSVTEQSEGKKKESKEKESVSEESMPEEKSTDDTSDNKRVLRKRKQTDYGGGGNNSKRAADACKSTEDAVEEISDSTKTPKSEPEDESSKIDTEVAQDTERADGSVEKADEKGEQLIVRVSTSSVTTNSECEGTEKESLSRREDDKKTNNLGSNEGEPPSLTESTSTTAVDDEGQSSSGGGEVAPPPSSDQLSHDPSTSDGGQPSKANEGDKVEPPKITDRSQLPSMVQIRTGMLSIH